MMKEQDKWIDWAIEIQSIAQAGLTYGKNDYDLERYQRLRDIAAEMIAVKSDISFEKAKNLFCQESGYQTPKVDTRAAIFKEGKILLVRENNGTWSVPGGWCEVTLSIGENTIKETLEEAGLIVTADRIIAIHDRNRHNLPRYAYGVTKVFVQCTPISGEFLPNTETIESRYFLKTELPENLAIEKVTHDQILMCFKAKESDQWETVFD